MDDMIPTSSAARVEAVLNGRFEIRVFDESLRTAAEAATALGCTVAQIAKSLVFRTVEGDRPVLVVACGGPRVDERKVAAAIGTAIRQADAGYVRATTGFAIGGVAPVGHLTPPIVLIDETLLRFTEIWAAAGTPHAVFRMTPADLIALTGGRLSDVARA